MWGSLLVPAAYSASVSLSQVISTKIPVTVLETSVIRSAAVGVACLTYFAVSKSAPDVTKLPAWVTGLSILSGVIMFFAAVVYVTMCRKFGVIATGVTTTAFSFLFTTIAGNLMSETVPLKTYAAMVITMFAIVLQKC